MSLQLNVMWGDGWPQPSPHTTPGLWDCMSDTVLHLVGRWHCSDQYGSLIRHPSSLELSNISKEHRDGWGRRVRGAFSSDPLVLTQSFSWLPLLKEGTLFSWSSFLNCPNASDSLWSTGCLWSSSGYLYCSCTKTVCYDAWCCKLQISYSFIIVIINTLIVYYTLLFS